MDHDDSLLEFPCRFPIKVMGDNSAEFQQMVIAIVRRHAAKLDPQDITQRESKGGRFISLTLTIEATSRTQLDAIYQELSDNEQVLMAL